MALNKALLILWLSFSLLSLELIPAKKEKDYSSLAGSKLVKLLRSRNQDIRSRAFYELLHRQCPQDGYEEFKKNYRIYEIIVCPSGQNSLPLYLVLYDYWASDPRHYYSLPPREIFEKNQDKTHQQCQLKWKTNMFLAVFDSQGGGMEIPGFRKVHRGVIADINGDGYIEVVDAARDDKTDTSPQGTVLKIWVVKEIPRCIFALLCNQQDTDWGYTLEDNDNDGIYNILLGPGKPGEVTPIVTYKWDTGNRKYSGPQEGEGHRFRLIDTAKIEEKPGEISWSNGSIGAIEKQKFENYNKPYSYVSLKNLSNQEILDYMKEGKSLNSLEWQAVKPKFPQDFWQKNPQEAILDLIEMNRGPGHKRQYQIAVDDTQGLEPPGRCRIFYNYIDNPYYTGHRVHYFIRCSPGHSYLAYAVWSTSWLSHYTSRDMEAMFKFRLCPIPDEMARHFASSVWWLNQVRSLSLDDDRGMGFDSFSTADGTATLKFKSGLPSLDFSITASDKASSIAETWNGSYDKETCLNFFTYLLHYGLIEKLKTYLDDSQPQLPGKDPRTAELAEFFMKNFSPDEIIVSIPIVAEAVRYAGASASESYLPILEKIHQELSRYTIPEARTPQQVYDEIKNLREEEQKKPGDDALNKKIKTLEEELDRVEVGSIPPVALDRLRGAVLQSKKQIAQAQDGAALEEWVKSGQEGFAWAVSKLKTYHPQRYIQLLEQQVYQNQGWKAIDAFYQLEDLAPEQVASISKKLLAEKRKDLVIQAFLVLVNAKIITHIEDWLPELAGWLTDPVTEWGRSSLLHFLVPADNPLEYKDECIDRALGTLLEAGPKDKRMEYIMVSDICLALALRGRVEYFFKIKEWIEKADSFSQEGEILLSLTYLARLGKDKYLTELERLLEPYLKTTNIRIGDVIRCIWAAGFTRFKDRLAEIATSGPEDYEDEAAYSSGPFSDVNGRYHMARQVCALWNEEDPVTRCKLWIAFGLADYYETMKNPACKLRLEEGLSGIASNLTREQKDAVLTFIDFCYQETSDHWKKQSEIWEMVRRFFLN